MAIRADVTLENAGDRAVVRRGHGTDDRESRAARHRVGQQVQAQRVVEKAGDSFLPSSRNERPGIVDTGAGCQDSRGVLVRQRVLTQHGQLAIRSYPGQLAPVVRPQPVGLSARQAELGLPSASMRPLSVPRGVRASPPHARTSSSPSMNGVFPRHSGCSRRSKSRKSPAGITGDASSPSTSRSASNDVLLPEPGSPSGT